MPKELKELRLFNQGTIASPAALDAPDEAAVYSLNIEAIDEEGKLKGSRLDEGVLPPNIGQGFIIVRSDGTFTPGVSVTGYSKMDIATVTLTISYARTVDTITTEYTRVETAASTQYSDAANNLVFTTIADAMKAYDGIKECYPIQQPVDVDVFDILDLMIGFGIEFEDNAKFISIKATGTLTWDSVFDTSEYLAVNANNMILFNTKGQDDLIYYSVTSDDTTTESGDAATTYRMKVIEDFYQVKSGQREITNTFNHDLGFQVNTHENVSLDKSNSAVHIGAGNKLEDQTQWFGKVQHKQFNTKNEEYQLLPAEAQAIDDGDAVFNLNHLEMLYIGDASSGALSTDYLLGISGSTRKLHLILNDTTATGFEGTQIATTNLPFKPRSIAYSQYAYEDLKASPATSTLLGLAWNGTSVDQAPNGHVHSGSGITAERTSYVWITEWTDFSKLHLVAVRLSFDSGSPELYYTVLDTYSINFRIKVDAALAAQSYHAENDVIPRLPRSDAYITDIMETYSTNMSDICIWFLMGAKSPFGFDEEWIYCAKKNAAIDNIAWDTKSIIAHPVTPPAVSLSKFPVDPRSDGYNTYGPSDIMDGSQLGAASWVGANGLWGQYANSWRWRNCDILGYMSNGNHVSSDADTGWHKAWSYDDEGFGADEDEQYPGGIVIGGGFYGSTATYGDTIDSDDPFVEYYYNEKDFILGYMYGWIEDYAIAPVKKGLARLDEGTHQVGVYVHLNGKQLTSNQKFLYNDRYHYPNLFTWKHQHWVAQTIDPTFEEYDEVVMFEVNPDNLGVRQRGIPDQHAFIKATLSGTGESGGNDIDFDTQTVSDGIKYGWRVGGNSVNSTDRYQSIYYSLQKGSEASTQTDFNDIVEIPDNASDVLSINKYMKNSGNDQTLYMSYRGPVGNRAYIQAWDFTTQITANPPFKKLKAEGQTGTFYNPLIGSNVGAPVVAFLDETTQQTMVGSTTMGDYSNGNYINIYASGYSDPAGDYIYGTGSANRNQWHNNPDSDLDFGINISFVELAGTEVVDEETVLIDGNFNLGNTYYYKMSLLYDGFQESPLSTFAFTADPGMTPGSTENFQTAVLKISLAAPLKRVSHVIIYRKNEVNDFYRMVVEVPLASGWSFSDDKNQWQFTALDEGRLGATYEAITGMPENLRDTIVNYKLSTIANGSLVTANCWHKEIKNGQNFLFKSQPGQYSIFDWSTNYTILPNTPTAIKWWAGKLYCFDESNTYIVDVNNMVLENTFEGVGCLGPEAIAVLDHGMFFCDRSNLYHHDGRVTNTIGTDIIRNSSLEDQGTISYSWQTIDHVRTPRVVYSPSIQAVMFMFKDANTSKNLSWNYSLPRKRWDLVDVPEAQSLLFGTHNDAFVSTGDELYTLASGVGRKEYEFHSKTLDMGHSTIDKVFTKVKLIFNTTTEATDWTGSLTVLVDGTEVTATKDPITSAMLDYKLSGNAKKGKKIQVKIVNSGVEIDAIGFIFRRKNIK